MVDQIQANKILPPLSSASEVKRLDRRGRHNQQKPFKEASKTKQKKKDPDEPDSGSASDKDPETGSQKRDRTSDRSERGKRKKTNDSSPKRIIDIRV